MQLEANSKTSQLFSLQGQYLWVIYVCKKLFFKYKTSEYRNVEQ